ncbi:MAG TPA: hypothetical protein VN428_18460 [Bryobacteraceae bacterium]|nr:hypothetical protein [Bryobacteraceae bacterium]
MRQESAFLCLAAIALAVCVPSAAADPVPLRVVVVEGEGAINNIREKTAKAPVVRVEDDDARPVRGATVTFTVPEMGPGGFFATAGTTFITTTDEQGIAIARGLQPNNVAGRFQIRVSAALAGETASAVVNQINAAPAEARGGLGKKLLIVGLVAGGAVGAAFAFKGGGSNGSPAAPPPGGGTTLTPGSPVFGPPR